MRVSKMMAAMVLATMLVGCGKGPATGVDAEATTKRLAAVKAAAPAKAAASTKPATTTKAPGVTTTPGKAAATTPVATAKPAADGEGAVKLTVRLWGTAPVTSLALQVVSVDDPTMSADVPLVLDGPEVVWETASLPAGTYELQIAALNDKGEKMGGGSTQALVVAGELADVTLDVTVDKATPAPTATPTPDSGVLETPSPTPTPTATATPATGMGGTLGLRVEVF